MRRTSVVQRGEIARLSAAISHTQNARKHSAADCVCDHRRDMNSGTNYSDVYTRVLFEVWVNLRSQIIDYIQEMTHRCIADASLMHGSIRCPLFVPS